MENPFHQGMEKPLNGQYIRKLIVAEKVFIIEGKVRARGFVAQTTFKTWGIVRMGDFTVIRYPLCN